VLHAGDLRHRVAVQARASGTGTRGEPTGSWSTVGGRWAEIINLSGSELEKARQLQADASVRVRFRFYSGLTTRHRLLFGSRVFQIGHIDDVDQLGVEHILTCSEVL
jgi:SPP1 family predicted phage head-tail adaptor